MSTNWAIENTPSLPPNQRYSWMKILGIWRRAVVPYDRSVLPRPATHELPNIPGGRTERFQPEHHSREFLNVHAIIQYHFDCSWFSVYATGTPPGYVERDWVSIIREVNRPPQYVDLSDSECSEGGEEDTKCLLCTRRQRHVSFVGCTHGTCTSCIKKIYWSRCVDFDHWPEGIRCPWCRHDVLKVKSFGGEIDRVPTFILYMSPRAIKKLNNAKIHRIVPVHMREWALETVFKFSLPKHRYMFENHDVQE
ncbi:uncharacterized protein H6S33_007960 [Morchella sextelata]|uniref:uncharacterized protein n=1 Tax=Morchella sextelata TaxID=1174677 RepID=UPI001D03779F|nr:uncharacterized protein H6S33_007960 [Morchella sextelata]KAH0602956.1 hypothetical protein H6S33_007960 [Morchella sextelata]